MKPTIRESVEVFSTLTDPNNERNIYAHPNPLARDIFWQRLEHLLEGLKISNCQPKRILDFGGGSGAFLKGLCQTFPESQIDVIDLDPADAAKVKAHYGLDSVSIYQANIETWVPDEKYELIIATDVLEHFRDLEIPLKAIKSYLKPNGLLAISVPTENLLYLAGRIVLNKTKPADHFHPATFILNRIKQAGFHPVWKDMSPRICLLRIQLFQLAIFRTPKNI